MKAIDLFAGLGGWTEGATQAGVQVVWAANHDPVAVEYHARAHPNAIHACQDLHQARWIDVPAHDLLLASPCCQGHSRARGVDRPHHDTARSTAWAVVSAAEVHRPQFLAVENVEEMRDWVLYPVWKAALNALGYSLVEHVLDVADTGTPQHRERLFIVGSRSLAPLRLQIPKVDHKPVADVLDWSAGEWTPVEGHCERTVSRWRKGLADGLGSRMLLPYYKSAKTGRSIRRPCGTLTTHDRYALVQEGQMRMMSVDEARQVMGFPPTTQLPARRADAMRLLGNAVAPAQARSVVAALLRAC